MNSPIPLSIAAEDGTVTLPLFDIHDRIIEAYNRNGGTHPEHDAQLRFHWICSQVKGKTVLDLGSSQGIVPVLLAREGWLVLEVDSSDKAIAEAGQRIAAESEAVRNRITLIQGELLTQDFKGLKADTVIIGEMLEQMIHPQKLLDRVAGLIAKRGRLVVTVPFGISDLSGHQPASYFLQPLKTISRHFEIARIEVLGEWLCIVASPRHSLPQRRPEVVLTQAQLEKLEEAFYRTERNLRETDSTLRKRLDEIHQKYRAVSHHLHAMKQQVAQERNALKLKGQDADSAEEKIRAAESRIAELERKLSEAEAERGQAAATVAGANARIAKLTAQFDEERGTLLQEIAAAREEAGNRMAFLQMDASQRVSAEITLRREVEQVRDQLCARISQLEDLHRKELEALHIALSSAQEASRSHTLLAEETRSREKRLKADLEGAAARLAYANQQFRAANDQVSALNRKLSLEAEAAKAEEVRAREDAEELARTLKASLDEANKKYRQLTLEEIPALKEKLEGQYSINRSLQHELEQARLDFRNSRREVAEAARKSQRWQQQKAIAEDRVIKTRDSLSFRLGYMLIHNTNSLRGMLSLPRGIWELRQEAARRRKRKAESAKPAPGIGMAESRWIAEPGPAPASPARKDAAERRLHTRSVPADPLAPQSQEISQPTQPGIEQRSLRQLRMACIMDEFTYESYSPECQTQQLTPANWHDELAAFRPELIFIESAWRGKDDLWGGKISHASADVAGIVGWGRENHVPTAFWNKEDPVHFSTFLNTARLFDYVFTTDIDCIQRYKAALGHDRVYLLPFACQPKSNNPIETYERKDAFCFAGAYYVRYPERTRDLGNFIAELPAFRPVEIFDRNYGKADSNYRFPPEYQPHIVGTLPFDQIDKAYKGYRYAINLNSIKQSQTMFARRIFELLACNTVTVGNFSRGVRLLLGDLAITTDSGSEMLRRLQAVAGNEEHMRKLRLAALRKVMREHTYGHRLAYMASRLSLPMAAAALPEIAVLARAENKAQLDLLVGHAMRQTYTRMTLHVVLAPGWESNAVAAQSGVRLISHAHAVGNTIGEAVGQSDMVAGMVSEDYYGPNYLLDLALATRYSDAAAIGKGARFAVTDAALEIQDRQAAYRPTGSLDARCAAIRFGLVAGRNTAEWVAALPALRLETEHGLAIDEFNYCRGGADSVHVALVQETVDDLPDLNAGVALGELLARAECILPEKSMDHGMPAISGKALAADFSRQSGAGIHTRIDEECWHIESGLGEGKHEYLYASRERSLEELGIAGRIRFYLDASPGLNLQLVIFFLDRHKQKISHIVKQANCNHETDLPDGSCSVRFGLRIYGPGSARIREITLEHRCLQPAELVSQAEYLVLTNHYPSYDDLYRNGFVHTRARAYVNNGMACEVFRLRPNQAVSYHEFEGIDVTTGAQAALHAMLASGRHRAVLVHFLDAAMWDVLRHHIARTKVIVWVHGAEIQPWHRRSFNCQTEEQRNTAMKKSEERIAFWRNLLRQPPANLTLVFVSRQFAEEVMDDLGFRIPTGNYRIIHNPIDTELFNYRQKPLEQRRKVLSIRPYASLTYANDLSVQAIQLLSQKPWFQEMEFRLIGDGPLFERTVAPLRAYRNVYLEQGFLRQSEIAALHKEHGIFLCPSRADSQGVSRDEAMSSGLVPVTNKVAAIPEFVDENCGILAPSDDAGALAKGIAILVEQPERFAAMSAASAARVRSQSAASKMIAQEIEMIRSGAAAGSPRSTLH